jgi:uncharacterized protein YdaU (DUF1376 family)
MSILEKGVYIELLADQWCNGPFSMDMALRVCVGADRNTVEYVVKSKFIQNNDGQWLNVRLEQERESQEQRRRTQRVNGAKGGRPKLAENPKTTHGFSVGYENDSADESQTITQAEPKNNPSVSVSVSVSDSVSVADTENSLSHPADSVSSKHFGDEEFRQSWGQWKAKLAVNNCREVDAITEQSQLYQLEDFETAEAIKVVRYSTSRTNCNNLITNGDHNRKPTNDASGNRRGPRVSFEDGLLT